MKEHQELPGQLPLFDYTDAMREQHREYCTDPECICKDGPCEGPSCWCAPVKRAMRDA